MIISASRRTDIPALYSQWFMNRVRAGWCLVPNPLNSKQVAHVPLNTREIDAIVFWSKNPAPMMEHLEELDRMGFRYYFQFTLNDYPRLLEPNVPDVGDRVDTFLDLSRRLGPLRVVWRYDPIIVSDVTSFEFHKEKFSWIAEELKGATRRVMVSVVDFYQKTDRRLSHLEKEGFAFDRNAVASKEMADLLKEMARIAKGHGMGIFTCAEEVDFSNVGIPAGRCIDERLLTSIWPLDLAYKKDPFQRKWCLCSVSKDIGMNDTCIHGCAYCYSTRSLSRAERRYAEHDPLSPGICSEVKAARGHDSQQDGQMGFFE